MLDLTPGEVIAALRQGDVDLALTYLGIDLLSRDFCTRKLSSVPSLAVLPGNHLLAAKKQISISQLKHEHFLRVSDECAPGYNRKVSQLCRQFSKFRPRFFAGQQSDTVAETISVSGDEDVVSLHPVFISHLRIPNVVMLPISDKGATWDLFVAWQRGKTAGPLRVLLDALDLRSRRSSKP